MAVSDKGVKERVQQYRDRVQMQQHNDGSKKAYGDDNESDCGEADHGPCPEQLMASPFFTSGDTARASSWTNRWHEEEPVDAHGPSHGASDEALARIIVQVGREPHGLADLMCVWLLLTPSLMGTRY